jgi:hypothetical protein
MTVAAAVVGMVAGGAVAGHAAPTSGHHERAGYSMPGGVQGVINGSTNLGGRHFGFVQVPSRPSDRTVKVSVSDVTGLPVAFEVAQWGSAGDRTLGSYCSTSSRIRLPRPGRSVIVYLNVGSCAGRPSVPTTGDVRANYR